MTFPRRFGPDIVRTAGPRPAIEISPPEPVSPPAPEPVSEPCVCTVDKLLWATLSGDGVDIYTDESELDFVDEIVTAALGRIGANNQTPMAPFLFYAGFTDASGGPPVICPGDKIEWGYTWTGAPGTTPAMVAAPHIPVLLVHLGYTYNNIDGDAVPNNMVKSLEPGILNVTATVCGKSLGPINLTIEASPDYYY